MNQADKITQAKAKVAAILADVNSIMDSSVSKSSIEDGLRTLQEMLSAKETNTDIGHVTRNRQIVIRNTGEPGNDYKQSSYQLACSICGHTYGANGTDIFERKCPNDQNSAPGLQIAIGHH